MHLQDRGDQKVGIREVDDELGAAAVEMAILAVPLLLLLVLAIAFGRVGQANSAIQSAAANAARAASIARDPGTAQASADAAAAKSMQQAGLHCTPQIQVNTGGFATPPGQAASVSVTVSCTVSLADLTVAGVPGAHTLSASSVSPLDTYRER